MKRITILIAAFMMVSATILAQPTGELEGRKKMEMAQQHQRHEMIPNLTDEQREAIKAIKTNSKKQTLPIHNQLGEKRAKMKTLTTADSPDMAQVDALIDEMSGLQAELMKIKARQKQEIRSLLNDEQRLAFDTQKHGMKGKFKHHHPREGGKF